MRTFIAMILPALIVTCVQACAQHDHDVYVRWQPTSIENVRVLCLNKNASGCVKQEPDSCTIITPHMPMEEFTGANYDMQSPLWRELSHELMHCFGYDHEPTPK